MCSLGIEPTTFCAADAMLYHWATQELVNMRFCAGKDQLCMIQREISLVVFIHKIWFTWHLIEDFVLLPMDKMNMTKASLTVWKWLVAFFFFVLKGKSCRRCLVEHLVHSDPLSEMFFFLPMNTRQCYCHDAFCSCCIDEAYMWYDLRMWHKKVLICR